MHPTLELPAHPGVFAVGDILDWREQKQAGKVGAHAAAAAANVVSFLDGRPQTKLYKGAPEMIVVPIGKVRGAAGRVGRADVGCRRTARGTSGSCGGSRWAAGSRV